MPSIFFAGSIFLDGRKEAGSFRSINESAAFTSLRSDPDGWAKKAILYVAGFGTFYKVRTIVEYAGEMWQARSCPVP
jgi:glucan phosphorylase